MMCLDVQLTQMDLYQPMPVIAEHLAGDAESRVDLLRMTEIQANDASGSRSKASESSWLVRPEHFLLSMFSMQAQRPKSLQHS